VEKKGLLGLRYSIEEVSNGFEPLCNVFEAGSPPVAGGASYFRHGTILPDIEPKDKDLIRIPPDESRAIDWRDYPPFFWE
jgi:hypothetical protein